MTSLHRSRPSRHGRGHRPAAVLAALLLTASAACSSATADDQTGDRGARAGAFGPDGPGPSDRPDPGLSGEPVPTLPPGHPGTGEGSGDGTGAGSGAGDQDSDHGSEDPGADPEVPPAALVDAQSVAALAGGTWSATEVPTDCTTAVPDAALAGRSAVLVAPEGVLVQTVAAYADPAGARRSVPSATDVLVECGFRITGDPRLGDASTELVRTRTSEERAMVLAADGATVVLVATGSAAAAGVWESLADIALGTACAAAPHGCH